MRKKEGDGFVGGPWPHTSGGYEICYRKDGKKRSEYRKDKKEAELRCKYWKETLSPGTSADKDEHPVSYWGRILRQAADLLVKNPGDRAISSSARALASLAAEGLKTAKYLPPPPQKDDEEGVEIGDISSMTTEELAKMLGE